jgi:Pectinacetylesterase
MRNFYLAIFLVAAGCSDGARGASVTNVDAGGNTDAGGTVRHDAAHGNKDAGSTKSDDSGILHKEAGAGLPKVTPLSAPPNQWTWSYIPGTQCLDGSQTGFAINPATTPTNDVLLFFEGGGACWDATTCWGPVSTSFYVATGYGQAEFETDPQVDLYILDRTSTVNPFANMNMIFVPYCSGDVFSGNKQTTLSYVGVDHATSFVGYENVTLFLAYLAATYPDAANVWLAGDSAGGFGAALNFEHAQSSLPSAKVQVLDDSGQPIAPAAGMWSTWMSAWNMQLPSACTSCQTGPGAFVDYYAMKYPNQRFGLLSYTYDLVIAPFMGLTETQFNMELMSLAGDIDQQWPNGHYFIEEGASHVTLLVPTPALQTWVQQMVTGDPSWGSVLPSGG